MIHGMEESGEEESKACAITLACFRKKEREFERDGCPSVFNISFLFIFLELLTNLVGPNSQLN